jgi:hypothetical protein
MSGRVSVRSDTFHRQAVQRLAGLLCQRELYARLFPTRLSKFDCIIIRRSGQCCATPYTLNPETRSVGMTEATLALMGPGGRGE